MDLDTTEIMAHVGRVWELRVRGSEMQKQQKNKYLRNCGLVRSCIAQQANSFLVVVMLRGQMCVGFIGITKVQFSARRCSFAPVNRVVMTALKQIRKRRS
jgi:hypothetical protein